MPCHMQICQFAPGMQIEFIRTVQFYTRRILDSLRTRIKRDAAYREERKNFTIERAEDVPATLRVVQSPAQHEP